MSELGRQSVGRVGGHERRENFASRAPVRRPGRYTRWWRIAIEIIVVIQGHKGSLRTQATQGRSMYNIVSRLGGVMHGRSESERLWVACGEV